MRLIIRLLILTLIIAASLLALAPVVLSGHLDAFYARFTTAPAGSLVLGTSRAAQGIRPAVLAAALGGRYQGPWLNYAFTLTHSPYGPAYLASIGRKLRPGAQGGLFVLAVDPWSLAASGPETGHFPEDNSFIGQLAEVSQRPNWAYLLRYQTKPLYRLPLDAAAAREVLHPDGWLEVRVPTDPAAVRLRTAAKLRDYRQQAKALHPSPGRWAALRATVQRLRPHGRVVLVRLPIGPGLRGLEDEFQADFDRQAQALAAAEAVEYYDYSRQPYATTDGNHLSRAASLAFSQRLAADLARPRQ